MPPKKSLIKRHKVETAIRKRTCKNSGEAIMAGEKCLVVYDGQRDLKTYSKGVALEMIDNARLRLDNLARELV